MPSQLETLVESRKIAPPPATAGNRLVMGWRGVVRGTRGFLLADPAGARIEGVNLGAEGRQLVLDFGERIPTGHVKVRIAGADARSIALSQRTAIPLPPQLPMGRFPIDLAFPIGTPPLRAAFDSARPAGEVHFDTEAIRQAGASLVELMRPYAGDAVITGALDPPARAHSGQRLELRQLCGGQDRVLWGWQPSWRDSFRNPRFRVRARCPSGWLRLRFVAPRAGDPGVWQHLEISTSPTAASRRTKSLRAELDPPQVVVLYVFDALRADAVGPSPDGTSSTPTLDALAAQCALFERHLAVAPNTLPSTKALFTGRIWRQGGGVPLGPELPTLAEAFRRAGYRTGLFSGSVYVSAAFGTARGFDSAPEETLLEEQDASRKPNENAHQVGEAALAWINHLRESERAFLYLHVIHPHNPYDPPSPFRERASLNGSRIDGGTRTLRDIVHQRRAATFADQNRLAALYRANLAYADAQLRVLLSALRSRYGSQRVLVVATSDHGEELFDHGGVLHGYTLYDEQLRIPLVIYWPGTIRPQRIMRNTSTAELHEALLTLARPVGSEAALLAPLLDSSPTPQNELHFSAASSVRGGIFAVRTPRWKVIWAPRRGLQWGLGEGLGRKRDPELVFDLLRDPAERLNLAGLVDQPEPLWLRTRLLGWARERGVEDDSSTMPIDAETRARLRALGYAN